MAKTTKKPFDIDPSKPLKNPKEEKACLLFVNNHNQTRAYKIAFKSKAKSAHQIAYRLFSKVYMQARVVYLTQKGLSDLNITNERILAEQARLAFADPGTMYDENGHMLPVQDMPEDIRRCIGGMDVTTVVSRKGNEYTTVKPRLISKTAALSDLMKNSGLFQKDNEQQAQSLADILALTQGGKK